MIDLYAKHISTTHIWQQLHKEALHPRLQLIDDLICTRTNPPRILIPDDTSFRHDLIHEIHDTILSGHPGIHKLLSFISLQYVGNHIRRDILEYVNTCPECQKAKPRYEKPFGICTPLPIAHMPWTDISMDLIMSLIFVANPRVSPCALPELLSWPDSIPLVGVSTPRWYGVNATLVRSWALGLRGRLGEGASGRGLPLGAQR